MIQVSATKIEPIMTQVSVQLLTHNIYHLPGGGNASLRQRTHVPNQLRPSSAPSDFSTLLKTS
jgi:hypothetical protein